MKQFIFGIPLCLVLSLGQAQSLSPVLISGAGGTTTTGSVYLSWSVGETAVVTLENPGSSLFLTQGFQQPELVGLVPVFEVTLEEDRLQLKAYPNPTQEILYLDWENQFQPTGWQYRLVDLNGRVLLTESFRSTTETINTSAYASGMYILQVFDDKKQLVHSVSIEIIH